MHTISLITQLISILVYLWDCVFYLSWYCFSPAQILDTKSRKYVKGGGHPSKSLPPAYAMGSGGLLQPVKVESTTLTPNQEVAQPNKTSDIDKSVSFILTPL